MWITVYSFLFLRPLFWVSLWILILIHLHPKGLYKKRHPSPHLQEKNPGNEFSVISASFSTLKIKQTDNNYKHKLADNIRFLFCKVQSTELSFLWFDLVQSSWPRQYLTTMDVREHSSQDSVLQWKKKRQRKLILTLAKQNRRWVPVECRGSYL